MCLLLANQWNNKKVKKWNRFAHCLNMLTQLQEMTTLIIDNWLNYLLFQDCITLFDFFPIQSGY
jgi:uncharacterized membrane protein